MSAFNTSGRKEDFSLKLKAQSAFGSMKSAKDVTWKLEQDNRKMEERLKELKMAMNREKEERERQGGSFWQRGHSGALTNYATEVLNEKHNKHTSKKKSMKVLKDEPLDLPIRSSAPGTMKFIAQRGFEEKKEGKIKGTKCGQCEDRAASLTCVQCSEHYCAGCFAAFHLRGALKRHRSVPLHATGPRLHMSPRPSQPASARDSIGGGTSGEIVYEPSDRSGPGGASGFLESDHSNLLDGAYNEEESAASFQKALQAWRKGDTTPDSSQKSTPRQVVMASPVKSPVVTVESSTSTLDNSSVLPEIKFSHSSLSYAQRLLLKQHRRTELGHLPTPRLDSRQSLYTPRQNTNQDDELDEERVRFETLFEAVHNTSQKSANRLVTSNVTITDVSNSLKDQRAVHAESSVYTVEEISSIAAWEMEHNARLQSQREVRQSPLDEKTPDLHHHLLKHQATSLRTTTASPPPETVVSSGAINKKTQQSFKPQNQESDVMSSRETKERPYADISITKQTAQSLTSKSLPLAGSKVQPKSSKSHSASVPTKSSMSRPTSRARSRAASRAGGEGVLTKAPSSELHEIAQRVPIYNTEYKSPMEGFFLVGVTAERPESQAKSRPITPAQIKQLKISNKFYTMSPRSWRPESSHGDKISADLVQLDEPSLLRYTYSGQLRGEALTWNPTDSHIEYDSLDTPTPVPRDCLESPNTVITPLSSRLPSDHNNHQSGTLDPDLRPYSAQKARQLLVTDRHDSLKQQQMRPNSSTGATEPLKRQKRQLPSIDKDLSSPRHARSLQSKHNNDGWTAMDRSAGDSSDQLDSTSRTRSWIASQNSLRPNSSRWETEVQPFTAENSAVVPDLADGIGDGDNTTPPPEVQRPFAVRSRASNSSASNEESGRTSRAVVVDGDDLTKYDDDQRDRNIQNDDDKETLDRLEWELASESGRLTADGKLSRLSAFDMDEDTRSGSSRSGSSTVRLSFEQGYDISSKLKEEELSDIDDRVKSSMEIDEEEVRALR